MTTMFSVNYQKRKNINLFTKFQTNKKINLSNVQNYIPIYDRFFSLNNTNYNSINLNHLWSISDIKEKDGEKSENIFNCKLKNISDIEDFTMTQKVFFKMAPLLDPFKYIVGKYAIEILTLPRIYATVSSASATQVLYFDDNGTASPTLNIISTLLSTTFKAYRGVAFAPCTPSTWYADADADGYGNSATTLSYCTQPINLRKAPRQVPFARKTNEFFIGSWKNSYILLV
jgi:hypothetical protein